MRAVVGVLAVAFVAAGVCAVPNKPVWPVEFDSPFALFDLTVPTPVVNGQSHFLYNWDQLQASRIQYPQQCVPLLDNGSTQPCDLYFNPNGTYLSQPALGQQCCLVFPGVGAVPPNFLAGFTWNSTQTAPDQSGMQHTCNYWTGSGFSYWTDVNTGHDIFFNDGGSGAYWAWGKFNVVPQDPSLFTLPGTAEECNTACPGFGAGEVTDERLVKVPMLRMAQKAQAIAAAGEKRHHRDERHNTRARN